MENVYEIQVSQISGVIYVILPLISKVTYVC